MKFDEQQMSILREFCKPESSEEEAIARAQLWSYMFSQYDARQAEIERQREEITRIDRGWALSVEIGTEATNKVAYLRREQAAAQAEIERLKGKLATARAEVLEEAAWAVEEYEGGECIDLPQIIDLIRAQVTRRWRRDGRQIAILAAPSPEAPPLAEEVEDEAQDG